MESITLRGNMEEMLLLDDQNTKRIFRDRKRECARKEQKLLLIPESAESVGAEEILTMDGRLMRVLVSGVSVNAIKQKVGCYEGC